MTQPLDIAVIETGIANNASVLAGLRRAGAEPRPASDASDIRDADAVMLPGVGAFAAGIAVLREHGFDDALRDRIAADRPTLAICLGLQLLFETSEESPGEQGLGILRGGAARFTDPSLRVPQLGWNRVTPDAAFGFAHEGEAYFANSFRITAAPEGWSTCTTDHGGPFVSALRKNSVLACQFHPELSGVWGRGLLSAWVRSAKEACAC